jgi:hypothetical protein
LKPSEPVSLHAPQHPPATGVVDVDVRALTPCDIGTVGWLARRALAERRAGRRIRLVGATPELAELVALSGLTRVLPCGERSDGA